MHTIKRINFKTGNCYLIIYDNKAILVDTCSSEAYDTVVNECSKYDMQLIVLTHVHFDHAQNAKRLSEHFNVPVAFHEADIKLFESFDAQPLRSYGIVGKTVLLLSLNVLRNSKVDMPKDHFFVKEGDSLSQYGIDASVIELPGHTNGSIGVDVEKKSLIVGDELDNWISPATGHLYYDMDALKKSADKISALGERTIYYGHGKETKNSFKKI